jgi:dTDP-4-amino-4,6-dideoxygalactose transaminase
VSQIPPLDLTTQYKLIGDEVNAAVLQVLASGLYVGGAAVEGFEQRFADYIGVRYAVSCNSGTDALYLALRSLGIGPGDEVITTPFTFFATAEVISAVGATPVFVDVEPRTFNLDLELIAGAITSRTRAIIPVHLFGLPVNLDRLMAIASQYNVAVIEDCAQAAGAIWNGKRVGSVGQVGCFSFFPTKNLGACGDGGLLTTNDPAIAAEARMLREHGSRQRYYHEAIGLTSRLDAIQATILSIKLRYLDDWNAARRSIAAHYSNCLGNVSGIVPNRAPLGGVSVWHQYTLRVQTCEAAGHCERSDQLVGQSAGQSGCDRTLPGHCRDWLKAQLQAQGIASMIYYPVPLHRQAVYESLGYGPGSLPVAEQAAREVLSLPMYPELPEADQDRVIGTIKNLCSPN